MNVTKTGFFFNILNCINISKWIGQHVLQLIIATLSLV